MERTKSQGLSWFKLAQPLEARDGNEFASTRMSSAFEEEAEGVTKALRTRWYPSEDGK
jgi:hypothetical protein